MCWKYVDIRVPSQGNISRTYVNRYMSNLIYNILYNIYMLKYKYINMIYPFFFWLGTNGL